MMDIFGFTFFPVVIKAQYIRTEAAKA